MHAVLGPEVGQLHVKLRDAWQDLMSMTPRSRGMMLAVCGIVNWEGKLTAYSNEASRDVHAQDGVGIPSIKEE